MSLVSYKYQLDPSSKKFLCPSCGKKRFVRYVNREKEYLDPEIGRCDREINCAYHKKPNLGHPSSRISKRTVYTSSTNRSEKYEQVRHLPIQSVQQTLRGYDKNNFVIWLQSLFGIELARKLVCRYYIGSAKKWGRSTCFWQIDELGKIRQCKVMLYNHETGRRVKSKGAYFAGKQILNDKDVILKQCLFGLHQIRNDRNKTIAIVESEKTAILATVYIPQYIWMATGGKNGAKLSVQKGLEGKRIILFPDLGCYNDWERKAYDLKRMGCKVRVSNYLEQVSTEEERNKGLDLADYFVNRDEELGRVLGQYGCSILRNSGSGF